MFLQYVRKTLIQSLEMKKKGILISSKWLIYFLLTSITNKLITLNLTLEIFSSVKFMLSIIKPLQKSKVSAYHKFNVGLPVMSFPPSMLVVID